MSGVEFTITVGVSNGCEAVIDFTNHTDKLFIYEEEESIKASAKNAARSMYDKCKCEPLAKFKVEVTGMKKTVTQMGRDQFSKLEHTT
jgi:hypothetical protein